ncbi:MAG: AmmeMemoRadiSam system radical SAM enzyme [Candidatus Bathyarchaeia archaeon]
MASTALFTNTGASGTVECNVCARHCTIRPGETGFCRVRSNENGKVKLLTYDLVVTAHVDTIEKKPAYHYRPGSTLLSLGTVGCNWSCDFCLNYPITQTHEIKGESFSPEAIIQLAKTYKCKGVAFTYNEPLVWLEFARDIGELAHREGLFNVIVTNGYGTTEAVDLISTFADSVTVGLKANGSQSFLKEHSGIPNVEPVFRSMQRLREHGVHLEISDLVIPQGGDSLEEAGRLCRWVESELGPDTPIHFVVFIPSHEMSTTQWTSQSTLEAHCEIALESGLRYVYVANFPGHERENTYCPSCGRVVIGRFGYEVRVWNLDDENRCKGCGHKIPIVGGLTQTPPEERYVPVIFPPMDLGFVCEGLTAFQQKKPDDAATG